MPKSDVFDFFFSWIDCGADLAMGGDLGFADVLTLDEEWEGAALAARAVFRGRPRRSTLVALAATARCKCFIQVFN